VVVVTDALARTAIGLLYDSIRFSSMRVEIADSLDEARRIIEKRQQEHAALPDQK
jgi:hypothetical protein